MKPSLSLVPPSLRATGRRFDGRGLVLPAILLILCEILALFYVSPDSFSLAPPHAIAVAFVRLTLDGTFLAATVETLAGALGGLLLGGTLGLALGLILGLSPALDRVTNLSIEALRPVNPAALIPLALLVYGFGFRMEASIVAFVTLWPILVLTRAAIGATEPGLLEVSRVLELGYAKSARSIVLPAALPRIFVAFRLAAAVALIVAVTVEIVANPRGLGYGMMLAAQSLHPDESFAFLVWIAGLGWLFNIVLVATERRFFSAFQAS